MVAQVGVRRDEARQQETVPEFAQLAAVHVEIDGETNRIYFEENGSGIPLVCLHTAGSDAQQWRHLLTDEAFTKHFRVIAFDMPWHGKSNPPDSGYGTEYKLTTASYTATIRAFCKALDLDKPVVMGCSIGGRIVLNLAIDHAKEFRALIGLEAADFQQPWYDTAWLNRPDVHGGEVCAAIVSGLVGPRTPEKERWETLWHYMQGGPGVFLGDLYFYQLEGDIRADVAKIDTNRCPLYLLTGEYDYSCSPDDTREVAKQAAGIDVTIMERLGHFPMSENPALFLSYLRPVLERIRAATA